MDFMEQCDDCLCKECLENCNENPDGCCYTCCKDHEECEPIPMEMKDSIDNQNGYILQLFLSGSYGAVLCTVYATYHSFGKRKCMYRKESHEDQGQEL